MIDEKRLGIVFGVIMQVSNTENLSSIRGIRYFGPSKMSFPNLIKHSLSIISVFKFTWFSDL